MKVAYGRKKIAEQYTIETTFAKGKEYEIEFDYLGAIYEDIEKFDEHLNVDIASTIEQSITNTMERHHKKYCQQCIGVFSENEKVHDDFISLKNLTNRYHKPCQSTVNIIKATNKILNILEDKEIAGNNIYDDTLKTIMSHLYIEELFMETNFNAHDSQETNSILFSHQHVFIYNIVREYMKLKSRKVGNRISEEEQGTYIRHNFKKRVQEAGQ